MTVLMVLEYAASPRLHDCNSGTEKSVCICNNYSGPQSWDHHLWSSELAADKEWSKFYSQLSRYMIVTWFFSPALWFLTVLLWANLTCLAGWEDHNIYNSKSLLFPPRFWHVILGSHIGINITHVAHKKVILWESNKKINRMDLGMSACKTNIE